MSWLLIVQIRICLDGYLANFLRFGSDSIPYHTGICENHIGPAFIEGTCYSAAQRGICKSSIIFCIIIIVYIQFLCCLVDSLDKSVGINQNTVGVGSPDESDSSGLI